MGKDHHAAGQKQGAKPGSGNLKTPHGHTKELCSFGGELKRVHKENREHTAGFRNGQKQK